VKAPRPSWAPVPHDRRCCPCWPRRDLRVLHITHVKNIAEMGTGTAFRRHHSFLAGRLFRRRRIHWHCSHVIRANRRTAAAARDEPETRRSRSRCGRGGQRALTCLHEPAGVWPVYFFKDDRLPARPHADRGTSAFGASFVAALRAARRRHLHEGADVGAPTWRQVEAGIPRTTRATPPSSADLVGDQRRRLCRRGADYSNRPRRETSAISWGSRCIRFVFFFFFLFWAGRDPLPAARPSFGLLATIDRRLPGACKEDEEP